MRVRVEALRALACLLSVVLAGAARGQAADAASANVVARIDGDLVTKEQFEAYTERNWSARIIRDMIVDRLIWKEAARRNVRVTPADVDRAIVRDESNYASDADFERALAEQGLSIEAYRARKHRQLVLRALRERDARVTEAHVRAYYRKHPAEFEAGPEALVSELVFDSLRDAYAACERIESAADFPAVADDLVAKGVARRLEDRWIIENAVENQALREALRALRPHETTQPVEDDTGRVHMLLLHERRQRPAVSLSEAAADIRARLTAERMLSEDDYVRWLIRRAKISVEWESCAWLQSFFDDARRIRVIVDGRDLGPGVVPVRADGDALLIPAKPVLTAIGAGLIWDANTRSLAASRGEHRVKVAVGQTRALVNGEPREARVAPRMVEGNLYLEPRLVLEALGAAVEWDARRYALKVISHRNWPSAEPPAPPQTPKAESP
ncbi:MAG: stalk domain-containing protein [Armatimonadota bacterium]